MLSRSDKHQYQVKAAEFAIEKQRSALLMEMGLGKTVSVLTMISDLLDAGIINRALIIAPLRVANSVWRQEALKWDHLQHLDIAVATGSAHNRRKTLYNSHDITVINRENVPWLVDQYASNWPFDHVVVDESSSFKSSKSTRWKKLKKVIHKSVYITLLTGTPAPNGIIDLWSQMYLIDGGKRLGRTMTCFKSRFMTSTGYMGYGYEPKPGAVEQIQALMSDVALSMSAEDYLELPERIDLTIPVTLSDKVMDQYKEFEKELLIEFEQCEEEVEAANAAVLAGKLLQFCNGANYTDEMHNYVTIHDEKLKALEDIINDNPNENILLAYSFKSDLERIKNKFPTAVVLDKQQQTIDDWNDGKIKLLLAHPQSAGHGLNIQRGGSLCVWFGLCWSLEYYQQFNARLHRQGQTECVRIMHIVTQGCIDEKVLKVLSSKDATQSSLVSALKASK